MFSFFGNGGSGDSDSEESQSDYSSSEEVEVKSMEDYYDDLEDIIADIREEIKDADDDPAFCHAAEILNTVIELCWNIESYYNPVTVMQINSERSRLLKTLGPDGMIEVKGEASKLLATRYRELMIAVANEEYWPNPPAFYAPVVHARYASELEKRADQTQRRIQEYQDRIDAYDESTAKDEPGELRRSRF